MSSRKKREPSAPFYALQAAPDRTAIANRVVSNARQSVRSLMGARPETPLDRSRSLFGVSARSSMGASPEHSDATGFDDRPQSSYSTGRRQFFACLPATTGLGPAVNESTNRPSSMVSPGRFNSAGGGIHSRPPVGSPARRPSSSRRGSRSTSERDFESEAGPAARPQSSRGRSQSGLVLSDFPGGGEPGSPRPQSSRGTRPTEHISTEGKRPSSSRGRHPQRESTDQGLAGPATTIERWSADEETEAAGTTVATTATTPTAADDAVDRSNDMTASAVATTPPNIQRFVPAPPSSPRTPRAPAGSRPPSVRTRGKGGTPGRPLPSRSGSADNVRISTAQHADAAVWDRLTSLIAQLEPAEASVAQLSDTCDQIHSVLLDSPLTSERRQGAMFRALIRLTDMEDCPLLLKVAQVILLITTSPKPRLMVCKLLFSLSRIPENDSAFAEGSMYSVLVDVLQSFDLARNADALIYACGTVKNVSSNNAESQQYFAEYGTVGTLSGMISSICSSAGDAEIAVLDKKIQINLLVQITHSLRNLADSPFSVPHFVREGVFGELCLIMSKFGASAELMLNVARILSKLTLQHSCQDALSAVPGAVESLIARIAEHTKDRNLVRRLLFTLGNLTAVSNANRVALLEASDELSVLFRLLSEFTADAEKLIAKVEAEEDETKRSKYQKRLSESQDALVQLVCVFANLSINADIGPKIASTPKISELVTLLQRVIDSPAQELILNIVGAINNISFYSAPDSHILKYRVEIASTLLPLLHHENLEVIVETARVFGNFSQDTEVREMLREIKGDQLMVALLDHDNQEIVYTVCGVLMNLMSDLEGRIMLKESGGIRSLVEVLQQSGGNDWPLAGMVCKTLWNFSEGVAERNSSAIECFGEQECEVLIAELDDFIGMCCVDGAEESDPSIAEFLPVAQNLFRRIEARSERTYSRAEAGASPLVPLEGPAEEEDE